MGPPVLLSLPQLHILELMGRACKIIKSLIFTAAEFCKINYAKSKLSTAVGIEILCSYARK
jgi:hypothetical protein